LPAIKKEKQLNRQVGINARIKQLEGQLAERLPRFQQDIVKSLWKVNKTGLKEIGNEMKNEFCPRCNALRNMVTTASTKVVSGPDGRKKLIQTNLFHCDTCNSFVQSEDTGRKA